jgi:hypothetical protein
MVSTGDQRDEHCPDCGRSVVWYVSQAIPSPGRLVWSRSVSCAACGLALEEDSDGLPPEWARKQLLSRNGVWKLGLVSESERQRGVVALRSLLGVDVKVAAEMLRAPGRTLWSGTQVECIWLKRCLENMGLTVKVFGPPDGS